MNKIEMIGIVAGALTTGSSIPQLIKIIKTKSAHDVSLLMFVTIFSGMLLWVIYGALTKSLALVLWNAVGVFLTGIVIFLKIRYSK